MTVFLIAATSADGFIAQAPDQISTKWTSAEDKKFFNDRTKQARVMVMGMKTYQTIGRPLPGRLSIVMTRKPNDAPADIPEQVHFTDHTPKQILSDLEMRGFSEVAICGGSQIYSAFLEAGLIDTLYLTVHSSIFGKGVPLFHQSKMVPLELKNCTQLSPEAVLLEYKVLK